MARPSDSDPADLGEASADSRDDEAEQKGRVKRRLLGYAMRYPILREGIGIQVIYRDAGGGLIVGGLSYAALFALIPTIVLAIAGLYAIVDDPAIRADAVELISNTFPALKDVTKPAVESAAELVAVGSIIAIGAFAWAASGLYVSLTRAMERFFPGDRVGTVLARIGGVLLVVVLIVGVLVAVVVAGLLTVIARALELDVELLLAIVGTLVVLAGATALVYAVFRLIPSSPPSPHAARLPALLVGLAIGSMTLLYSFLSPWLVSSYQAFGAMASVFAALVWLRVVFMAMIYGAAMAKYRDLADKVPDDIKNEADSNGRASASVG